MIYNVKLGCAAILTLGMLGAVPASAQSIEQLRSACRTGVMDACSQYNAAVFGNSTQAPMMMQGYDPFGIVPATVQQRAPAAPDAATAGKTAAEKAAPDGIAVVAQ